MCVSRVTPVQSQTHQTFSYRLVLTYTFDWFKSLKSQVKCTYIKAMVVWRQMKTVGLHRRLRSCHQLNTMDTSSVTLYEVHCIGMRFL